MQRTDARTLFLRSNRLALRGSLVAAQLALVALAACATADRPNVELVLAREAFSAASEVDSAKYAPAYFHKAEETYRRGMAFYKDQKYKEAIGQFKLARVFAERAENAARIQRQKAGEEGL